MKKLLLGCLIVGLLLGAGTAAGLYFFVWKPVTGYIAEITEFANEYERVEEQVDNQQPFPIPRGGLLTQDQVERFVSTQRSIRSRLGETYQRIEDKYSASKRREMGLTELLQFFVDMRGLVLEAKQAQVAAINEHGFSMEEYRWVRKACYQALGADIANSAIDEIVKAAKEQDITGLDLSKLEESRNQTAPQHNIDLLKPYRDQWQNWAPYGWLGI